VIDKSEIAALFGRLDDAALLGLWASVMSELTERGVVRSDNNPIGDYCEFLVAAHLGVIPEASSTAGYDVLAPDGAKVQVKGRRLISRGRKPPHFSAVRRLADDPPVFDYLVGVILNRDFSVAEAWEVPIECVRDYARYRPHTNSWSLPTINRAMQSDPRIKRINLP
jgi:hypothetical protein